MHGRCNEDCHFQTEEESVPASPSRVTRKRLSVRVETAPSKETDAPSRLEIVSEDNEDAAPPVEKSSAPESSSAGRPQSPHLSGRSTPSGSPDRHANCIPRKSTPSPLTGGKGVIWRTASSPSRSPSQTTPLKTRSGVNSPKSIENGATPKRASLGRSSPLVSRDRVRECHSPLAIDSTPMENEEPTAIKPAILSENAATAKASDAKRVETPVKVDDEKNVKEASIPQKSPDQNSSATCSVDSSNQAPSLATPTRPGKSLGSGNDQAVKPNEGCVAPEVPEVSAEKPQASVENANSPGVDEKMRRRSSNVADESFPSLNASSIEEDGYDEDVTSIMAADDIVLAYGGEVLSSPRVLLSRCSSAAEDLNATQKGFDGDLSACLEDSRESKDVTPTRRSPRLKPGASQVQNLAAPLNTIGKTPDRNASPVKDLSDYSPRPKELTPTRRSPRLFTETARAQSPAAPAGEASGESVSQVTPRNDPNNLVPGAPKLKLSLATRKSPRTATEALFPESSPWNNISDQNAAGGILSDCLEDSLKPKELTQRSPSTRPAVPSKTEPLDANATQVVLDSSGLGTADSPKQNQQAVTETLPMNKDEAAGGASTAKTEDVAALNDQLDEPLQNLDAQEKTNEPCKSPSIVVELADNTPKPNASPQLGSSVNIKEAPCNKDTLGEVSSGLIIVNSQEEPKEQPTVSQESPKLLEATKVASTLVSIASAECDEMLPSKVLASTPTRQGSACKKDSEKNNENFEVEREVIVAQASVANSSPKTCTPQSKIPVARTLSGGSQKKTPIETGSRIPRLSLKGVASLPTGNRTRSPMADVGGSPKLNNANSQELMKKGKRKSSENEEDPISQESSPPKKSKVEDATGSGHDCVDSTSVAASDVATAEADTVESKPLAANAPPSDVDQIDDESELKNPDSVQSENLELMLGEDEVVGDTSLGADGGAGQLKLAAEAVDGGNESTEEVGPGSKEEADQGSAGNADQGCVLKASLGSVEEAGQSSAEEAAQRSAEEAAQGSAEDEAQGSAEDEAQSSAEDAAQSSAEDAAQSSAEGAAQSSTEEADLDSVDPQSESQVESIEESDDSSSEKQVALADLLKSFAEDEEDDEWMPNEPDVDETIVDGTESSDSDEEVATLNVADNSEDSSSSESFNVADFFDLEAEEGEEEDWRPDEEVVSSGSESTETESSSSDDDATDESSGEDIGTLVEIEAPTVESKRSRPAIANAKQSMKNRSATSCYSRSGDDLATKVFNSSANRPVFVVEPLKLDKKALKKESSVVYSSSSANGFVVEEIDSQPKPGPSKQSKKPTQPKKKPASDKNSTAVEAPKKRPLAESEPASSPKKLKDETSSLPKKNDADDQPKVHQLLLCNIPSVTTVDDIVSGFKTQHVDLGKFESFKLKSNSNRKIFAKIGFSNQDDLQPNTFKH
ncbi:unnamed protein product [Nesidiocoris tenuis]|uniref:Uncharacterized protein n=1 Tax=Nesidiocoris tenuis TaxID=355587 RepID=A0A6H5H4I8_9HEMI|nr:unnamed protein product [Nesidiocoris tenuis]